MKESALVEKRDALAKSFNELNQEKIQLEERIKEIVADQYRIQGKHEALVEIISEIDSKKEKK